MKNEAARRIFKNAMDTAQERYDAYREESNALRDQVLTFHKQLWTLAGRIDSNLESYAELLREEIDQIDFNKMRKPSDVFSYLVERLELAEMASENPIVGVVLVQVQKIVELFDEHFEMEEDKKHAVYQLEELANARVEHAGAAATYRFLSAQFDLINIELERRKLEYRPGLKLAYMAFYELNKLWTFVDSDEMLAHWTGMLVANWNRRDQVVAALMEHPVVGQILPVLEKMGIPLPKAASVADEVVVVSVGLMSLPLDVDKSVRFFDYSYSGPSEGGRQEICSALCSGASESFRRQVVAQVTLSDDDRRDLAKALEVELPGADESAGCVQLLSVPDEEELETLSSEDIGLTVRRFNHLLDKRSGSQGMDALGQLSVGLEGMKMTVSESSRWAVFSRLTQCEDALMAQIKDQLGLEGDPPQDSE